MTLRCRALIPDDYDNARALYETLSTGASLPDISTGAVAFETVLMHQGTTVIAEVEGQIVSMATLHILPNMTYGARPYALIENVATLPSHQGRGYGRAVMQTAADHAWTSDVYKLMLLTGQDNEAKGFYTRLGYDADEKFGLILRCPTD